MTATPQRRGIAIVGMACRFPGANDLDTFWRNLRAGIDSIRHFSDAELIRAGVPEAQVRRPDYVKAAPVIDGFDLFDAEFFEYSPREARLMDPQQRILLEEAWHALEDAGHPPGRGSRRVGAFMGSGGVVTSYLLAHAALHTARTGGIEHLANDKDFLSTKLSYKLDLTGPSINVQTACSTSMVAVHLACQSILDGECDMALAGASTLRVPQIAGYQFRQGDILSPDGRCRAYDADAQGTVFGSGTGVVVLKHVEDAIADGDRIYAVILGSAVNNDGAAKVSYTASSTEGQARAMAEAFAAADVAPSTIGYVEGHGTGTVVGDPLEVEALRRCFATDPDTRPGGCHLGSVKTNIGHLEQAAGIASLIKTALALHHRVIPPSLNFERPNPRIDFAGGPFRIPTAAVDWGGGTAPRRAAVNSLGLGGTNAFAILEEAPAVRREAAQAPPVHVLALGARSADALGRLADRWRDHLAGLAPEDANDACFTAAAGRAAMPYRRAVTGGGPAELARALLAPNEPSRVQAPGKLAFLFPGQGAQYPGMARAFHASEPTFRAAFDSIAARLASRTGVDIAHLVFTAADAPGLARTAVLQPALFAVEWALAAMLAEWGLRPDAVLGHSAGAFAAAAVAGVYTPEDAADLVAERAALMGSLPEGGAMLALLTGEAEAIDLCHGIDGIGIAALNGPANVVVSGEAPGIDAIEARAARAGIATRRLQVSHAFHSPLMAPAATALAAFAAGRTARAPALAFVSDMTGAVMTAAPDGQYLADHVLRPVRFADGLRALSALGCTDFIEVGPGGALRGFAAATLAADRVDLHGLLSARGDDWAAAMKTLGRLWEKGHPADIAALYRQRGARRAAAPLYPFARTRYWLKESPAAAAGTAPGLSGTELRLPGDARRFQGAYSVAARPWIADHRVYRHITLPVAAALAGLAEAGARVAGQAVEVRALTYREACVLDAEETLLVDIEVPRDLATGPAVLSSCAAAPDTDTPWRKNIEARLHLGVSAAPATLDLSAARAECGRQVAPAAFYETLDRLGLNYGRGFRNVRDLRLGAGVALARISADADLAGEAGADAALVHPAILDACLHIFPAVSGLHGAFDELPPDGSTTFLPITVERFAVFAPMPSEVWSLATLRPGERPGDGRYVLDIRIHADDGSPLALIEGLAVKRLPEAAFLPRARSKVDDWLYRIDWVARPALPLSEPTPRGRWLVIAETPGDVRPITDALKARGADWCVLRADDLIDAAGPGLAAQIAASPPIAGVLLATALGTPPLMSLEPADLTRETERQFLISTAALHLISETLASDANQPRLWILTCGAQAPLGDHLGGEALQAVLWGHGRVIALEHPAVHGGLIDIDDRTDGAAVLDEIFGGDGEDQIALRDGRRFAPRLVRNRADDGAVPVGTAIQAGRSYLVTGGLGTLGLKVAGWLVRAQGARHLWLVSRRAPSTPQQAEIAALQAMGAVIHVVSADISDPDEVAALIARVETDGPALHGVFHCAGLLDDGIMIEMDWARYHRVTAAKIEGAWALHRATEHLDLGHFVLFSSILSVIGSMGQMNYVAANAFLDALVAYRRRLGLAATALNWGPWEDAGLATESGERGRAIWRARGTRYIPADEGIEAMAAALAQDADHMVVTLTDWERFVTQFARPPKLYDALARGASGAERRQQIDRARILEQLRALPPDRRHGPLVEALGQICATILDTGAPLDPDRSLREAGLDSLMSISVINEIEAVFGTRLPARALLRGPSVMELAQMVLSALPDLGTPGPVDTGAAPGAVAQPSRPPSPPDQARTGGAPGAWLVIRRPRPDARVQLVCFPFAGGGSAVFDGWGDAFDPAVEIVAVEPPGRLGRINEAPVRTVEDFARGLLPELAARLDRPYAVLGHCLGGLTLYETLRFLQARKLPMPVHIFVSGARPPSVLKAPGDFERELDARLRGFAEYQAGRPGFEQPDAVFSEVIRAFGISESSKMLDVEELRGIVLPTVRAEFQMANRYVYLPEAPFPVPLTCFRGVRDAYFRDIDAGLWRKFTSKRFELFNRDTGHFAIVEDFDFIRRTVESRLLGQCADSA